MRNNHGSASPPAEPSPLLVSLCGGNPRLAHDLLALRSAELTRLIVDALDRLGAADADSARDIEEAFATPPPGRAAPTVPAGAWRVQPADIAAGWPAMSQDRIAASRVA